MNAHGMLAASLLFALASPVVSLAQGPAPSMKDTGERDTLKLMAGRISVDWNTIRLEDAITWIRENTGIRIVPLWASDRRPDGLDRGATLTLKLEGITVRTLIESVLEETNPGEGTWQLSASGACQIGTRAALNKDKRIHIYDVRDLLTEVPTHRSVPKIDLQQALQSGQNGQPFTNEVERQDPEREEAARRTREADLIALIRDLVEPSQWVDNGGTAGTIRYFQGSLIVSAPDYMHRGIDGHLRSQRSSH